MTVVYYNVLLKYYWYWHWYKLQVFPVNQTNDEATQIRNDQNVFQAARSPIAYNVSLWIQTSYQNVMRWPPPSQLPFNIWCQEWDGLPWGHQKHKHGVSHLRDLRIGDWCKGPKWWVMPMGHPKWENCGGKYYCLQYVRDTISMWSIAYWSQRGRQGRMIEWPS